MPYAPGIQDISGQILAQGMVERSRGISAGIENFIKGYDQNQALKRQAMSTFAGAAAADPDLLNFLNQAQQADIEGKPGGQKVPPEVLKAYARAQKGDVDLYDASILGNFAGTYQKTKSEAQQRQLQAAQIQMQQAQAARLQQETAEAQKTSAYFDSVLAGTQPQGQMAAPAPQAAVPSSVPYYLARPGAPEAAQPPAQAIQAVQAAQAQPTPAATRPPEGIDQFVGGGLRTRTGWDPEAEWSPNNPVGVIDEDKIRYQMTIARRGRVPEKDVAAEADRRAKMKKDAMQAAEVQLSQPIPNPRDGGRTLIVVDKQTGRVVSSMPNKEHPDVAAQTVLATEQAKSDSAFINEVRQKGATAQDERFVNAEIRKILSSGVRTGPIEGFKAELKRIATNTGLASEEEVDQANSFDKLDSLMMRQQLDIAQSATRGNLNTFEQQLVQRAVAGARNKLPGANAYLNDVVDAYKAKMADRARFENQLPDNLSTTERAKAIRNWELRNENSINSYFQQLQPKVERVRLTGSQLGSQVLEGAAPKVATPVQSPATLPSGWSLKR